MEGMEFSFVAMATVSLAGRFGCVYSGAAREGQQAHPARECSGHASSGREHYRSTGKKSLPLPFAVFVAVILEGMLLHAHCYGNGARLHSCQTGQVPAYSREWREGGVAFTGKFEKRIDLLYNLIVIV